MEAVAPPLSALKAIIEARRDRWLKETGGETPYLENQTPNPPTINEPLPLDDKLVYGVLLGTGSTVSVLKYAVSLSEERTEASLQRLISGGLVREYEYDDVPYFTAIWNPVVKETLPQLHQWLIDCDYVVA